MYFMHDVVIDILVVIHYSLFLYVKPWVSYFSGVNSWNKLEAWCVFGPLLCKYVGCNFSQSGYLIFKLFWGSMPPDPPRIPRTNGKNWKYLHLQWDPDLYKTLIAPPHPPPPLQILKHGFCGTLLKLYVLPCDNWKENWNKAWRLMPVGGCI